MAKPKTLKEYYQQQQAIFQPVLDSQVLYQSNDAVQKARDYAITTGVDYGFEMVPVSWEPVHKGIDDLLHARIMRCS